MAGMNGIDMQVPAVRKSFVITVDVDESRTTDDLKFISSRADKAGILDALTNKPGEVFFEGQEDLAARWMAMGNGALPLNLFMSQRLNVTPAPVADVTQALNILKSLFNEGALDCLPTGAHHDALREVEDRLKRAERLLQGA